MKVLCFLGWKRDTKYLDLFIKNLQTSLTYQWLYFQVHKSYKTEGKAVASSLFEKCPT